MPNLSKADGTPTGGVYGFMVMAVDVIKRFQPDYVCVAWDKSKTNIRSRREIFPEYKANRKPAPPDFYVQIPILRELLDTLGWPLYEFDDYEADDIMGTLARKAPAQNVDSILITGDHDVLQAVDEHTTVAIMKKGITNIDLYTPKTFAAKYSMTTDQFVEYKALRGDPSDNIPGIKGVGEKTAIKLIEDFGSIEGIYADIDAHKGALKAKLEAGRDFIDISKKLVTLMYDAPIDFDPKATSIENRDPKKLTDMLSELEFRTLLKQLPDDFKVEVNEDGSGAENNLDLPKLQQVAPNKTELKALVENSPHLFALSRAKSAHGAEPQFLALAGPRSYVVLKPETMHLLNEVLGGKTLRFVAHDAKNVLHLLAEIGVEEAEVVHDTRMAAFLLNSLKREQQLSGLLRSKVGIEVSEPADIELDELETATPTILAGLSLLHTEQLEQLNKNPELASIAAKMEWPILSILATIERAGALLDVQELERQGSDLASKIEEIEQAIYGLAGKEFNIASPIQLSEVLFTDLELPSKGIKKTSRGFSTAAGELAKLKGSHDIVDYISGFRELSKLKSTYLDTLPNMVDDSGRVHTTYSIDVVPTGRLSSHDPNLQNIPVRTEMGKRIRTAFIAPKGKKLIQADYSQFELRIAAALSGDEGMVEAFNNDADIHQLTAAAVHGIDPGEVTKNQRRDAKAVNFGILYGQGPHGLAEQTGMSMKEASEFIERYFTIRPKLKDYLTKLKKQATDGEYVATLFGRRRPTIDAKSSNFAVRNGAIRAAINHPIQGTAADLMKMAMVAVDRELGEDAPMTLQVHDSVIVEVDEVKAEDVAGRLTKVMEAIYPDMGVKLKVDTQTGNNWGDL